MGEQDVVDGGLLAALRALAAERPRVVARLQAAGQVAAQAYRYYNRTGGAGGELARDPLVEGAFPDGGALGALVVELEARARGGLWPACARELERPHWYTSKQYCGAVPYDAELARLRKAIAGASRLTASRRAELEKEAAAFEARLVYRRARL